MINSNSNGNCWLNRSEDASVARAGATATAMAMATAGWIEQKMLL
jgi:hypothetical protein